MSYMDEQDRVVEDEKVLNKELSEELGRTYQLFRGGDELSGEAKEAMDEAIKKMLSDINMTRGGPILNSYMMAQPYFDEGIVPDELTETLEELYQKGKLPKVGEIPNTYAMRQPQENNGTIEGQTASWKKQPDGSLQMDAAVDIDNHPTNIPDKEICAILDDLFAKGQLPMRKVIYAKTIGDMIREVTEVFLEYSYGDRKFVRVKAQNSGYLSNGEPMVEGNYCWIEVKPNVIDKTNDMEEGSKRL